MIETETLIMTTRTSSVLDDIREWKRMAKIPTSCRHMDTINRKVLDFDVEKVCSVCPAKFDVFACLGCGKYFHGIGKGQCSHAYIHSCKSGHRIFMDISLFESFYCLDDDCGCQIDDPSLDDIRKALNPRFSRDQVLQLDRNVQWSKALDGSDYIPGMVGLSNINETDVVNVAIQSLMRVTPLRNFFLVPENYDHINSKIVHRFGSLTRKIWHARNCKGQVTPYNFLHSVRKLLRLCRSDARKFTSWLLKTLHRELKDPKTNRSIIYDCFEGEKKVTGNTGEESRKQFMMLALNLRASPLSTERNLIPESPLVNILKNITRLPRYLILYITKYKLLSVRLHVPVEGKNPTLVNFPLKDVELRDNIMPMPCKYDLVANIVHDGERSSPYSVFVQRKSEQRWYHIQDHQVEETLPQTVAPSEAYMLIYERQQQEE